VRLHWVLKAPPSALRQGERSSYFAAHPHGEDLADFDVAACTAAVEAGGDQVMTSSSHHPTSL
jgi:hypothetical protein